MAHRSGGGSHSGGHHSGGGGHHGGSHGGGGSRAPRYSNKPFPNSKRLRYFDRHGRERFIFASEIPDKWGILVLIIKLLPFVFPVLCGVIIFLSLFIILIPPEPLKPVYMPTDVHIMDEAGLIDNEDSLESVLQKFEDKTGISPYVMTVYDEDWENYDELYDYAYNIYIDTFSDEQHFLIVYSEPENAAELDFVDWSWEGVQGDETDRILTESKSERFGNDLHNNFLRNDISVGEAFESAFKESLTYIMTNLNKKEMLTWILVTVIWNTVVFFAVAGVIRSYIIRSRDYQEVPMEGSSNTVSGAMEYGSDTAYQNGQMYQSSQVYQSDTNNTKKYMYYDKKGNKKYVSSFMEPNKIAFVIMLIVLLIVIVLLFRSIPFLWEMIKIIQEGKSLGEEIPTLITFFFVLSLVWNLVLFIAAFFAVRYYIVCKNRDYVEVTGTSALYNEGMTNNSSADSDFYNEEVRFRGSEDYDDARYHGSNAYESDKK